MVNEFSAFTINHPWIFKLLLLYYSFLQKVVLVRYCWECQVLNFLNANQNRIIHDMIISQELRVVLNDIQQFELLMPRNVQVEFIEILEQKIILIFKSFCIVLQESSKWCGNSFIKRKLCIKWSSFRKIWGSRESCSFLHLIIHYSSLKLTSFNIKNLEYLIAVIWLHLILLQDQIKRIDSAHFDLVNTINSWKNGLCHILFNLSDVNW